MRSATAVSVHVPGTVPGLFGTPRDRLRLTVTSDSATTGRFSLIPVTMSAAYCLVLCIGVSGLVGTTRGACDVSDIDKCAQAIASSLANPPNLLTLTLDAYTALCKKGEEAVACIHKAEAACPTPSWEFQQKANDIINGVGESCSQAARCVVQVYQCPREVTDIDVTNIPTSPDFSYCRNLQKVGRCYRDKVPRVCGAYSQIQTLAQPFLEAEYKCYPKTCSDVQKCLTTYRAGDPMSRGFYLRTCSLYATFAGCLVDARCDDRRVAMPRGEPTQGSDISALVQDGCDAMGIEPKILYCNNFTACVGPIVNNPDAVRADMLCPTIQKVAGCAARYAETCGTSLLNTANQVMIKLASKGCGEPDVNVAPCAEFAMCKNALTKVTANGIRGTTFNAICVATKDYLQCAADAAGGCHLLPPDSEVSGLPTLRQLAPLAKQLCTDMYGEHVQVCREFILCLGNTVNIPSTDGGLLNPVQWCSSAIKTIECAKAYEFKCRVSADLKRKLNAIRKRFIDEGNCPDDYPEQRTAGAESLVGVSLLYMLMLSLALRVIALV